MGIWYGSYQTLVLCLPNIGIVTTKYRYCGYRLFVVMVDTTHYGSFLTISVGKATP